MTTAEDGARSSGGLPLAAAAGLQLFCYVIAWCTVIIFILYQFVILLGGWTWIYTDPNNIWEKFRAPDISGIHWYNLQDEARLFSGWDSMMLVFTWLPAILASIITLVPVLVLTKAVRKGSLSTPSMMSLAGVGRKVIRVASYPMFPHKFWLWWCNGLSVWDAFMWSGFLIMHIIGVVEMTKYYQLRYDAWDAVGLAYSQPKSVYNLEWISFAFSWTLYLDFTMLFFPAAHLSFLHQIMGSSWQAVLRYHRWLGHFGMWTTTGHALFFYWYWLASTDQHFWQNVFDWNHNSSINFFAGTIAWVFGLVLWVTSVNWFRRRFFKIFYAVHIFAAIGFVVFAHMHYYWSWLYFAPGLILYGLDVVFRVFQAQHVSAVSSVSMTPNGNLARLEIPLEPSLAAQMKAGEDVFVQFPSFSRWAYHPFTIYKINNLEDPSMLPSMTIVIKKYGRWTQTLLRKLKEGAGLPVRVVGPVGRLHSLGAHASRVVMFVGGVGASPALALVHRMIANNTRIPTTVIFAARDKNEFTILDEQLLQEACRTDDPWLTMLLFDSTAGRCMSCGQDKLGHEHHEDRRDSTSSNSGSEPVSGDKATWKMEGANSFKLGSMGSGQLPDMDGPSTVLNTSGLSAFGWRAVRPMQPRVLNNWHMLLAICLAWTGGFMGAVQAQSGLLEKWYPRWTEHDGWAIGAMFVACIGVQAVGLPAALVVFPVHLYKYLRSNKTMQPVAVPASPYLQTLGRTRVGLTETGLGLEVRQGRPDIPALLKEAIAGATGEEIPVIVAGPTGMMNAAEHAAWNVNRSRSSGQPFLHVIREAYEL